MADDEEACVEGKPLSTLRVVELKQELGKRGLSKAGTKNQLVERLTAQLLLEELQSAPIDQDTVPNLKLQDEIGTENEYIRQYLTQQQHFYEIQKEAKRKAELEENLLENSISQEQEESPPALEENHLDTQPLNNINEQEYPPPPKLDREEIEVKVERRYSARIENQIEQEFKQKKNSTSENSYKSPTNGRKKSSKRKVSNIQNVDICNKIGGKQRKCNVSINIPVRGIKQNSRRRTEILSTVQNKVAVIKVEKINEDVLSKLTRASVIKKSWGSKLRSSKIKSTNSESPKSIDCISSNSNKLLKKIPKVILEDFRLVDYKNLTKSESKDKTLQIIVKFLKSSTKLVNNDQLSPKNSNKLSDNSSIASKSSNKKSVKSKVPKIDILNKSESINHSKNTRKSNYITQDLHPLVESKPNEKEESINEFASENKKNQIDNVDSLYNGKKQNLRQKNKKMLEKIEVEVIKNENIEINATHEYEDNFPEGNVKQNKKRKVERSCKKNNEKNFEKNLNKKTDDENLNENKLEQNIADTLKQKSSRRKQISKQIVEDNVKKNEDLLYYNNESRSESALPAKNLRKRNAEKPNIKEVECKMRKIELESTDSTKTKNSEPISKKKQHQEDATLKESCGKQSDEIISLQQEEIKIKQTDKLKLKNIAKSNQKQIINKKSEKNNEENIAEVVRELIVNTKTDVISDTNNKHQSLKNFNIIENKLEVLDFIQEKNEENKNRELITDMKNKEASKKIKRIPEYKLESLNLTVEKSEIISNANNDGIHSTRAKEPYKRKQRKVAENRSELSDIFQEKLEKSELEARSSEYIANTRNKGSFKRKQSISRLSECKSEPLNSVQTQSETESVNTCNELINDKTKGLNKRRQSLTRIVGNKSVPLDLTENKSNDLESPFNKQITKCKRRDQLKRKVTTKREFENSSESLYLSQDCLEKVEVEIVNKEQIAVFNNKAQNKRKHPLSKLVECKSESLNVVQEKSELETNVQITSTKNKGQSKRKQSICRIAEKLVNQEILEEPELETISNEEINISKNKGLSKRKQHISAKIEIKSDIVQEKVEERKSEINESKVIPKNKGQSKRKLSKCKDIENKSESVDIIDEKLEEFETVNNEEITNSKNKGLSKRKNNCKVVENKSESNQEKLGELGTIHNEEMSISNKKGQFKRKQSTSKIFENKSEVLTATQENLKELETDKSMTNIKSKGHAKRKQNAHKMVENKSQLLDVFQQKSEKELDIMNDEEIISSKNKSQPKRKQNVSKALENKSLTVQEKLKEEEPKINELIINTKNKGHPKRRNNINKIGESKQLANVVQKLEEKEVVSNEEIAMTINKGPTKRRQNVSRIVENKIEVSHTLPKKLEGTELKIHETVINTKNKGQCKRKQNISYVSESKPELVNADQKKLGQLEIITNEETINSKNKGQSKKNQNMNKIIETKSESLNVENLEETELGNTNADEMTNTKIKGLSKRKQSIIIENKSTSDIQKKSEEIESIYKEPIISIKNKGSSKRKQSIKKVIESKVESDSLLVKSRDDVHLKINFSSDIDEGQFSKNKTQKVSKKQSVRSRKLLPSKEIIHVPEEEKQCFVNTSINQFDIEKDDANLQNINIDDQIKESDELQKQEHPQVTQELDKKNESLEGLNLFHPTINANKEIESESSLESFEELVGSKNKVNELKAVLGDEQVGDLETFQEMLEQTSFTGYQETERSELSEEKKQNPLSHIEDISEDSCEHLFNKSTDNIQEKHNVLTSNPMQTEMQKYLTTDKKTSFTVNSLAFDYEKDLKSVSLQQPEGMIYKVHPVFSFNESPHFENNSFQDSIEKKRDNCSEDLNFTDNRKNMFMIDHDKQNVSHEENKSNEPVKLQTISNIEGKLEEKSTLLNFHLTSKKDEEKSQYVDKLEAILDENIKEIESQEKASFKCDKKEELKIQDKPKDTVISSASSYESQRSRNTFDPRFQSSSRSPSKERNKQCHSKEYYHRNRDWNPVNFPQNRGKDGYQQLGNKERMQQINREKFQRSRSRERSQRYDNWEKYPRSRSRERFSSSRNRDSYGWSRNKEKFQRSDSRERYRRSRSRERFHYSERYQKNWSDECEDNFKTNRIPDLFNPNLQPPPRQFLNINKEICESMRAQESYSQFRNYKNFSLDKSKQSNECFTEDIGS